MMVISTRGRYSLRILILMASQPQGHMFTKNEIAEAEAVPPAYVQQLMIPLKAGGFVSSHRGKVGGFTLARAAETITVAEVLSATEGPTVMAPCLGGESCEREPACPTRPMWMRAAELLDDFFSGVTIAGLVKGGTNGYPWAAERI
jgi:Rrf2 family protein